MLVALLGAAVLVLTAALAIVAHRLNGQLRELRKHTDFLDHRRVLAETDLVKLNKKFVMLNLPMFEVIGGE